jgi:hypothetical protein
VKTWKPLWHFLLDVILVNCFLLSSYHSSDAHRDTHKQFRKDLRQALFEQSTRRRVYIRERPLRNSTSDILWYPVEDHKLVKLFTRRKQKYCSACIEAGSKTQIQHRGRRKPLSDLSPNTTRKPRNSKDWRRPRRAPRTLYGCSVCRIPFCRKDGCWLPYIERLKSKD